MLCCCFTGGILALGGAGIVGLGKTIQNSSVFVKAVERAKSDPDVRARLGEPITTGFGFTGNIQEGTNGRADFQVTLKGPKAEGSLHVIATKPVGGEWIYTRLEVETLGTTIDVLGTGGASPEPVLEEPMPDEELLEEPPVETEE